AKERVAFLVMTTPRKKTTALIDSTRFCVPEEKRSLVGKFNLTGMYNSHFSTDIRIIPRANRTINIDGSTLDHENRPFKKT
ncbi:hypothetical protein, partial [Microcystis sp. M179S2]|uniref:hypothetical protein n=2 Tax=Microcystis TaxID=1125 RepID=UPI00258C8B9B